MRKKQIKIPVKIFPFLGFLIFAYVIYMSGKAFLRYQRLDQEIKKVEQEVSELEEENLRLKNLIVYFQSQSYKEKELRERLGYQKPGEKVIYFVDNNEEEELSLPKEEEKKPNWKMWLDYLFKS